MAPQGSTYDVDWIFSNNSNVHVANHRDWFTNYTAFKTFLGPAVFHNQTSIEVLGIGDVELEVRRSNSAAARKKGRKTSIITLRDVLHAPGSLTNIFGSPILRDYGLVTDGQGGKITDRETQATVGLLDKPLLWKMWLKGQKRGQTSLDPDGMYAISVSWAGAERKRWEAFKQTIAAPTRGIAPTNSSQLAPVQNTSTSTSAKTSSKSPAYTTEEKKWLKDNYRGEFHFLRDQGLSINKEEDRDEGKLIARAMMEEEGERARSDNEDDEEEEEDDFLADLEADPMSHFADRFFSDKELDWIKKQYRHSGNFLMTHGLKAFDDEDCKEGVSIARAFMKDDRRG